MYWVPQPDGTMLGPGGEVLNPDGSVTPPSSPGTTPPGGRGRHPMQPAKPLATSLAEAAQLRAQIIDRWNATYYYNQVSAQSRAFLVQNANAFNKWYKGANAQQAKMDADFPAMASTSYAGTDAGEPKMTQAQQDRYYAPWLDRSQAPKGAYIPGVSKGTPKTPKAQKMRSGMTGADAYAMKVARELAKWK